MVIPCKGPFDQPAHAGLWVRAASGNVLPDVGTADQLAGFVYGHALAFRASVHVLCMVPRLSQMWDDPVVSARKHWPLAGLANNLSQSRERDLSFASRGCWKTDSHGSRSRTPVNIPIPTRID